MGRIKTNKKKERSFGLITGIICLGYSAYSYYQEHAFNTWIIGFGVFFILAGLIIPIMIHPFRLVMEFVGHWLGIANTYILLTLIYIILFIPLNLFFKMTGKDNLKLKWNKEVSSYWIERPQHNESSMKNQF